MKGKYCWGDYVCQLFIVKQLKWLSIEEYKHLSKGFIIRIDKDCSSEIPWQHDGMVVMRVKHVIRQKNILKHFKT